MIYPIAPIGSEIINRAAYSPWSNNTTRPRLTVAARMITKKTALNTHWTPTNWPQLVHWVSARISRETDTESLEQFGHFLFKDYAPQFLSTVRHGSVAEVNDTATAAARAAGLGGKAIVRVSAPETDRLLSGLRPTSAFENSGSLIAAKLSEALWRTNGESKDQITGSCSIAALEFGRGVAVTPSWCRGNALASIVSS